MRTHNYYYFWLDHDSSTWNINIYDPLAYQARLHSSTHAYAMSRLIDCAIAQVATNKMTALFCVNHLNRHMHYRALCRLIWRVSSTAQSHKSPLRWWRFFASITSLDTRTIERYAASFEEYNAQCIEHHAHNHEQLNIRLDRYAPWTHMPPPGLRGTPWFDTLSSSMSHS